MGDLPKAAQEQLSFFKTSAHGALVCGLGEVPGNPEIKTGRGGPLPLT